jgi:hypothetical protein
MFFSFYVSSVQNQKCERPLRVTEAAQHLEHTTGTWTYFARFFFSLLLSSLPFLDGGRGGGVSSRAFHLTRPSPPHTSHLDPIITGTPLLK